MASLFGANVWRTFSLGMEKRPPFWVVDATPPSLSDISFGGREDYSVFKEVSDVFYNKLRAQSQTLDHDSDMGWSHLRMRLMPGAADFCCPACGLGEESAGALRSPDSPPIRVDFSAPVTESSSLLFYELGFAWCALHLLIYVAILRNREGFFSERRIFLYHAWSATLYSLAALVPFILRPDWHSVQMAAGLVAAHGIYSISFLELWSLAQGSYSISILDGIAARAGTGREETVRRFAAIGEEKKAGRVGALSRLGLIRQTGEFCELTFRGRAASSVLRLLRLLPNLRNTG